MKYLSLIFLLIAPLYGWPIDHKHEDHVHGNEIAISLGPNYNFEEEHWSPAVHLHYVHGLGEKKKFGIGAGLEAILDEHRHYGVNILFNYRPIEPLALTMAPGIAFEEEHSREVDFATHFEVAYEFELGEIHLGPAFEYAISGDHQHMMVGFHVGYTF